MYSFYLPKSGGSSNGKTTLSWEQPQKPLSTAWAGSLGSRRLALLFYAFIMLFATTLTAGASPIEVKATTESTETLSNAFTCYLKVKYYFPPIKCYGGTTTVTLTAEGGTAPFQYSINNGTTWQSSNVFSGLKAGYYTVCIRDCKGCKVCVVICIVQPPAIVITPSYPPIKCYGGTTSLTLTASGGAAPYLYSINGGASYQSGNVFTNVTAGTYTVCVKDCRGCVRCKTITIGQPAPIVITPSYPPIKCYGGTTTLTVTASGGAAPYLYSINNGATYQSSNVFAGLSAGTYYVCVKDCKGCVRCCKVVIGQPAPIVITPSYPPIKCYGETTTLTVTASGGAAPYQYSINGGAYGSSNVFAGLTAGTYKVCVRDCRGCVQCIDVTIGQPAELKVVCGPNSPPSSGNASDGSLSVIVSGGTPPYSYTLTGGGITRTGSSATSPITIGGLPFGSYTIKIVDKNGCHATVECQVPPPVQPPCENIRIFTQGGYGQEPNGGNVGAYLEANFARVLQAYPGQAGIVIGCSSGNTLTFTSAAAVRAFLPSGTKPRPLDITDTDPTREEYRNNFAGQVLTLAINAALNPNLYVTSGTFRCMEIGQVLAEANRVLGGCSSAYSLSELHEAATRINESKGTSSGYLSCTLPSGCSAPARVAANETNQASFESTNGLRITAAPNPASMGRTTLQFSVAETTEAAVDMYSITGAKIGTLFKGRAEAGQVYKVEFNGVDAKGQSLRAGTYIYRLSTPNAAKHGRLIFLSR